MISVTGLEHVLSRMAAYAEIIEKAMEEEGLVKAAEAIKESWQSNIESEGFVEYTGHYHDSITVTPGHQVGDDGPKWVAIHSDVPYASILEYGDSRQEAHPVAQRAADENHGEVLGHVADAIHGKLV